MILTENLGKRFGDFQAVEGVNLEVGTGEVLALLGPNGAGKTTTVRMLTSILKPTSGWARVAGFDVVKQPAQVRARVGVLTEHHGLYHRMPAYDYLDFFGRLYQLSAEQRKKRIEELLSLFGLSHFAHERLGKYSKGMRQKLALARALLHDPPVLLLDEPTSAMDPESARLVRDAIRNLRSEHRAVIICTHNLMEAEELADQIAIIRRGRIIIHGSPQALRQRFFGAPEFELRLVAKLDGCLPPLPQDVEIRAIGEDWLRFRTPDPAQTNPQMLSNFLAAKIGVISLQEVPRRLEEIYLEAVQSAEDN